MAKKENRLDVCQHRFYFIETSRVTVKRVKYHIDKYECSKCRKLYLVDKKTNNRAYLDDALGEEVT